MIIYICLRIYIISSKMVILIAQKEYKTRHDWWWGGDPLGIVQEI